MILSPAEAGVEDIVANAVLWLKLGIEMIGATVIGVGAIVTACVWRRPPISSPPA